MQTFLPYPTYMKSARALDRQRLGKQRVETLQLLKALHEGGGWSNHPAARMWRGYEPALVSYGAMVCIAWRNRGYKDTCLQKILAYDPDELRFDPSTPQPPWLGDPDLHASHRSNLLRKYPEWYGSFGWEEPDDLPYVWPVSS